MIYFLQVIIDSIFHFYLIFILILRLINWSVLHFFKILNYAIVIRVSIIWIFFWLVSVNLIRRNQIQKVQISAAPWKLIIFQLLLNRLRPLTHLIIIYNQPLILNLLKIFDSTFAAICKLLAHYFIPFMQTLFIAFILIYKFQLVLFKLLLNNIFAQVIKQFSQLVRLDSNKRVLLLCENIDFNRGFLRSQSVEFINKRSIFSYKLA